MGVLNEYMCVCQLNICVCERERECVKCVFVAAAGHDGCVY